ncbi:S8 family serine peptidase [Micromonospora lupini]|uniref:S8 family serine peptidase n=1 Tax=Micromonospora lupini TaxID=285679 RepID=UPI0031DBB1F2
MLAERIPGPRQPRGSVLARAVCSLAASLALTAGATGLVPSRTTAQEAQAAGRADPPPELPVPADGQCVGASPTLVPVASWALNRIAPQLSWPLSKGRGISVAVVDSGVDARSPALAGALRPGADPGSAGGANRDCLGRGTALAGIVAARPMSGSGFVGVAPESSIVPVRVVNKASVMPPGTLAKGIRAATASGARVTLVGTGLPRADTALRAAIAEAVAHDVVVVAPVASDDHVWFPAADDRVLAVGGVDAAGTPTEQAVDASGLDLLAPATGAYSIGPVGRGHYAVGGAAVAAAEVAGAAALLRAYRPELDQQQVRRLLIQAAEPAGAAAESAVAAVGRGRPAPAILDLHTAISGLDIGAAPPPPRRPHRPTLPVAPSPSPARAPALFLTAALVVTALLAFATVVTVRAGRRRRWRVGDAPAVADEVV